MIDYTQLNDRHTKLPVWAQEQIMGLVAHVKELQESIQVLEGEHKESPITMLDSFTVDPIHLPERCSIKWQLGQRAGVEVSLVKDGHIGTHLRVYTNGSAMILPRASNSFYLKDI